MRICTEEFFRYISFASFFSLKLLLVQYKAQQKENSMHVALFFDKGKNASQAGEIMSSVYGSGTLTAKQYKQLCFRFPGHAVPYDLGWLRKKHPCLGLG